MEISDDELKKINETQRKKILQYVAEKYGKPEEFSSQYWYMLKNGKRPISDSALKILLKYLSYDEYVKLLSSEPIYPIVPDSLTNAIIYIDTFVNGVAKILEKYPELETYLSTKIMQLIKENERKISVTEEHLKKFEMTMKAKGRSERTIKDQLNYLRRMFKEINWELSRDKIVEYMNRVMEESPFVAKHTANALKPFIKEVLQDKQLYDSFKTPKVQFREKVPIKLEEIKAMAKALEHIPSKAYFVLLTESGLRPGELLAATIDNIDLKERIIWVNKETQTKRAYFSFFSRKTAEFLEKVYLPLRDEFVRVNINNIMKLAKANEDQGIDIEKWKKKLFPYKDDVLRNKIYEAMDKALGRRFELYALRRHFATYMQLKKVPPLAINILQGRVGPNEFRILKENYTVFTIEDLRKLYDETGLVVLE
ncbi:integrase family protein [Sulfolobus islandicus L.S.2.15]|uniref:Integrase family protein n=1 Tax=Saccharolobus islandicus (strain L.S.2.15 / Lassen \|nr:tyrosine-type recombinase/integrase [Sulfolobus islandicus]ACP36030.1 integrase family protein [Sulfolobus islandicus L.S.2.15]